MSNEKDFKKKFKKSTEETVKANTKNLYPVSNKDLDTLKGPSHKGENKAVYDTKESGSNSYHANNLKLIKDLKRDA
tara:strand:- start:289 stop:516 length:228 start_codon:yes stop_codon:yes gene_type:complete